MEILFAIFGVTGLLIVSAIWRGYVFSVLWGWFVVPFGTMAGVTIPLLSIPLAIGLAMVVSFLSYQYHYSKDDRSPGDKITAAVSMALFYPALVLLCGWVVTLFL